MPRNDNEALVRALFNITFAAMEPDGNHDSAIQHIEHLMRTRARAAKAQAKAEALAANYAAMLQGAILMPGN